jgi:RNA polymerase sigma-70 factor (ECF subfamily)
VAGQLASFDLLWPDEVQARPEEPFPLEEPDDHLIAGLRAGDEVAYEALLSRFQQPVFNLVSRLLKDTGEACDVVQEVFLKVFRKIDYFRGDSSLKTWIYRIAVNEAHNHGRWNGRHRRQEVGLDGGEDSRGPCDTLSAPGDSPFDYVLDRERHRLMEGALAELSPSFRSVVVLRDVEDLSYEEIAEILDVPLGTVKSRILRGREALRRELEKRLERDPGFHFSPQIVR